MNIYVFRDVLTDWTSGMIVVRASSAEEAVTVVGKEFPDEHVCAEDVILVSPDGPAEVISYVYGGG